MTSSNQKAYIAAQFSSTDTMVFIDTCSFLTDSFPDFVSVIVPLLSKNRRYLYIDRSVISELKHICQQRNHPKAYHAFYALSEIESMDRIGIIKYSGNAESCDFADEQFLETFLQLRKTNTIRLITQDFDLARDSVLLNGIRSSFGFQIESLKLTHYGGLKKYSFNENTDYKLGPSFIQMQSLPIAN